MDQHHEAPVDFGTGEKRLSVYLVGLFICVLLTLLAFWIVMAQQYAHWLVFSVIYIAAILQFFVQVICFLRLNLKTTQSRINVMSLLFTGVILLSIVAGSLWIMWNLNYNMLH